MYELMKITIAGIAFSQVDLLFQELDFDKDNNRVPRRRYTFGIGNRSTAIPPHLNPFSLIFSRQDPRIVLIWHPVRHY